MYKSYRCDENVQILEVKSFENVYKPSDLAVNRYIPWSDKCYSANEII